MSKTVSLLLIAFAGVSALLVAGAASARRSHTAKKPKPVVISTRKVPKLGTVLVDGKGRTLYMFVPDRHRRVTCKGTCAVVWPPVELPRGAKIVTKGKAKASLTGSDRNPAGGRVVTYDHWPLYTYIADRKPGQAKGQALNLNGGLWYVLAPSGKVIRTKLRTTATAVAALTAKTGSAKGAFRGTLHESSASSGTLSWSLTYSRLSSPVTSVQLRKGGELVVRLSGSDRSGAHKTKALRGAAFKAVAASTTAVLVATKRHPQGELTGALEVASPPAGPILVKVTPAAVARGKMVARTYSCTGCHTVDGTASTGPTWKGLAGSTVRLIGGGTTKATDSYLVDVITDPGMLRVAGFDAGVMQEAVPPGEVSNADARALVAYIKSLG